MYVCVVVVVVKDGEIGDVEERGGSLFSLNESQLWTRGGGRHTHTQTLRLNCMKLCNV